MENVLPQTLYVEMQDDGDGDFFPVSNTTIDAIDDGVTVGVYELRESRKVSVVRQLN